jgi:small subunit ribosomal protein S8
LVKGSKDIEKTIIAKLYICIQIPLDYLTRVRNAVAANHKVVEIPASNLKKEITKILFDQGYILSYKFEDNAVQGSIKIALKYDKDTKESVIKDIQRISKPGLRKYSSSASIPRTPMD